MVGTFAKFTVLCKKCKRSQSVSWPIVSAKHEFQSPPVAVLNVAEASEIRVVN